MEEESRGEGVKKVKEDDGNIGEPAVTQNVGSAADNQGIGKNQCQPVKKARLGILPSQDEDGEPDEIAGQTDEKIDQGEGNFAIEGADPGTLGFDLAVATQGEDRPVANLFLSQDKLDVLRLLDFEIVNPDEVSGLDPIGKAGPGAEQEEPIEAERCQDQTGQQGKSDEKWRFLPHSPIRAKL